MAGSIRGTLPHCLYNPPRSVIIRRLLPSYLSLILGLVAVLFVASRPHILFNMFSKAVIVAFMIAFVQARFGQEQVPIQAISDVTSGGDPGEAATIAGAAISDLLGAANPCDKLKRGDEILAELGTGADAIAAAIGIVAAEQNFNPSATDRPVICNDPTLPTNALLRGITPLVDPAVTDAATANALSASSQAAPFNADGLSVADILAGQGFTTFTTKDQAGAVGATGEELAGGAVASTAGAVADAVVDNNAAVDDAAVGGAAVDNGAEAAADTSAAQQTAANNGAQSAGLDFGKCVPTIKFVGGLGGRPATEFTFQAIDPLIAEGQQEALNPAIIVNRVCDQLTNVCEANDAAKQACLAAQAAVDSTQRNAQTAIDFNTALGFANVDVSAARRRAIEGVKRRSARY